jgi:hypothetical protein
MTDDFEFYDIGEPVQLRARFAQSPTTVTVVVMKPDGTYLSPSPTVDPAAAPLYTAAVVPDVPGPWGYRFTGTGAYSAVEEGVFVVRESAVLAGAPAYTYDLATLIGKLRLLVDDRDLSRVQPWVPMEQRSAIWTDAELQVFLDNNSEGVYLAAGEALTVLAGNRQLLVQSRRIADTTVDYGSIRSDLLKQAGEFRSIGYGSAEPADGIAQHTWTDFNLRRVVTDTAMRNT